MTPSYYCFEVLSDSIKKANKIRSKVRLDCTKAHLTGGKIEMLVTAKGQVCVYPCEPEEVVKANTKRHGIINLTNGTNFSTVFTPDLDFKDYGFGDFRNDALLFILNANLSKIEMLVFEEMRYYQKALYEKLIDGEFDKVIENLRETAEPIYNYKIE